MSVIEFIYAFVGYAYEGAAFLKLDEDLVYMFFFSIANELSSILFEMYVDV